MHWRVGAGLDAMEFGRQLKCNKTVGRKKLKRKCNTMFKVPYEEGILCAVSYDETGKEIGRRELKSAESGSILSVLPEKESAKPEELQYIELRYTDGSGIWKPMEKHHLKIKVANGTLMGFGSACPYNKRGYHTDEADTYYGEALAIVKAGKSGTVQIAVQDENREYSVDIPVQQ